MFGLLGPNGAGKTTLMRILAGLLEPTSGTATLDGESMLDRPERIWRAAGLPAAGVRVLPAPDRREDARATCCGSRASGRPAGERALCRELLERVNLSFAARRKVKTYSGGMRQRLGIAQAIAGDPRLIIVDEPTAGLDPEERLRFYRLLSELAADRIVLLSTHIVEDVAVLCPRFAVIRERPADRRHHARRGPRCHRAGRSSRGPIAAESYERLLADPERCVTQAYLVEGRNRVRVYQPDGDPPPGFVAGRADAGGRLSGR